MDADTIGSMLNLFASLVGWASIISILLPPIELFDGFPRFQSYYWLAVKLINHYAALNLRGKIAEAYLKYRNGRAT